MESNEHNALRNKVASWLTTQGYPLEMQVARAFLSAGFLARQAVYYEDPDTKTPREIDVIAHAQAEVAGCLVRLTVCIDCKVSKGKPWVLLTSPYPRLAAPAQVVQRAASRPAAEFLISVAHNKLFQELQLLRLPPRPAFGLTQAFTNGNDLAYTACMSAAKAAAAQAAEADFVSKQLCLLFEIAVPAIVIDAHLFECFLDEGGEIAVKEVPEGTLLWGKQLVGEPHTIVRVVTVPYLPQFAQEAREAAGLFLASEDEVKRLKSTRNLQARS